MERINPRSETGASVGVDLGVGALAAVLLRAVLGIAKYAAVWTVALICAPDALSAQAFWIAVTSVFAVCFAVTTVWAMGIRRDRVLLLCGAFAVAHALYMVLAQRSSPAMPRPEPWNYYGLASSIADLGGTAIGVVAGLLLSRTLRARRLGDRVSVGP